MKLLMHICCAQKGRYFMAFPIESYAAKIQRKLLKKQRVFESPAK